MSTLPSAFGELLLSFLPVFTAPSFANFAALVRGWVLCRERHTIAQVIRQSDTTRHFSTLYRFFARARWSPDQLGRVLFRLLRPWCGGDVTLIVDDTLARHEGPHFWGAAMHYDAHGSTYGAVGKRHVAWACGLNWVVLAVWLPLPFRPGAGVAVPVLWRLYRSKKQCPQGTYCKRTELAREMLWLLCTWLGPQTRVHLLGDREYACRTLLRQQPGSVHFTGPMPPDAAFYDLPRQQPRTGRRRVKGERMASPKQLAADDAMPWQRLSVTLYGRPTELQVKTQDGLWYQPLGTRHVRMIVTRDPAGRYKDRAYVCTDLRATPAEALERYTRRWTLEVTFRDAKQHLGLEQPQNGWWRRHAGDRPGKRPGPQPHRVRGAHAVGHTTPFVFALYGLVHLWYFRHGQPENDAQRLRLACPWYRHKMYPSFADMLAALRRDLLRERLSQHPLTTRLAPNVHHAVLELAAAA